VFQNILNAAREGPGTSRPQRCPIPMPLTPSRFALWGRMTVPLLVAAAFFGPSIAAFATARPVVAAGLTAPPPIPVISVHPFLSLDDGSCTGDSPLHVGPTHQTNPLFYEASLRARM